MKFKVRNFLAGVLVGMLIMVPYVYHWMKFPVIQVIPVPENVYNGLPEKTYKIEDVITKKIETPTDLLVTLTTEKKVREYCSDYYSGDCSRVMGFYIFDRSTMQHRVYSIDNARVLQHEIRHVFEGSYHRAQ